MKTNANKQNLDAGSLGDDLVITKTTRRSAGAGTWVCGTIHGHRFDALLTDLTMPGLTGDRLALLDQLEAAPDRRLGIVEEAAVREGVRRHVEDAHDPRAVQGQLSGPVPPDLCGTYHRRDHRRQRISGCAGTAQELYTYNE